LINFLKDLYNFIKFKRKESDYKIGFFSETNFILQYLKPYIKNKQKKNKIIIISFQDIDEEFIDQKDLFVFKTNFFRELVFLTLNLKFLYSSTPDINKSIFKRSKLHQCKYIYLQHTPVSLTMIYSSKAFNEFDAVQTISKFQHAEMLEIKEKFDLKTKIFKSTYLFVKEQFDLKKNFKKKVELLIAPSWNSSFYKLNCHKILSELLFNNSIDYKIRPHPMSYIKNEITKKELLDLNMKVDESSVINFFEYDFFISDWSGLFLEYALLFKKKSFLINTPKKIVNENYKQFKSPPVEIFLRNKLCKTYEIEQIKDLINDIKNLKNENQEVKQDIYVKEIVEKNFY
jgi:hypothetical protein